MPGSARTIVEFLVIGLGLAVLAWRVWVATKAGRDAREHGWSPWASLGWAACALVYPAGYWRRARLERLAPPVARQWLASVAGAHALTSVVNVRCPLCDAEISNALTLVPSGRLAITPHAQCPRCDFRLDACRHCRHFLPAQDEMGGQPDMTHGRCDAYRASQPVNEAYPQMAKRLVAMGYESLNAPKPIVDSFIPLDECTSFELKEERLRRSRVAWLGWERTTLIRLQQRLGQAGGPPGVSPGQPAESRRNS